MSSLLSSAFSWFWNDDVWLPPNITWDSFKEPHLVNEEVVRPEDFASFTDLAYPIPLAVVLLAIRYFVMRYVFRPLGLRMGLKDHKRALPKENVLLEEAFRSGGYVEEEVPGLASKAGLSEREVSRWLLQRHRSSLPNTMHKFCETGWRWLYYSLILVYGSVTLWGKPWLWNIRHCWYHYPYHKIDRDVWLYYMVELSFYWSLSISQFFDVARKDFWEMFVHHNTTILLIMFSWTTHFTRIGSLVLLLHDQADHLLELAKMFRYTRYQKCCDVVFVVFSVVWIVTRCLVYPSWILYSTFLDAAGFIPMFPAYYIFNGLLGTLQILHILWTYFLIKAIKKALSKGSVEDERSDSEPSEDEEELDAKKLD